MSAGTSARTVRQADGLDPVRALQRVLYRSAKQDRTRRSAESIASVLAAQVAIAVSRSPEFAAARGEGRRHRHHAQDPGLMFWRVQHG